MTDALGLVLVLVGLLCVFCVAAAAVSFVIEPEHETLRQSEKRRKSLAETAVYMIGVGTTLVVIGSIILAVE